MRVLVHGMLVFSLVVNSNLCADSPEFVDSFDDGTFGSFWTTFSSIPGAQVKQIGGRLRIDVPTMPDEYKGAGIRSKSTFGLQSFECSVDFRVSQGNSMAWLTASVHPDNGQDTGYWCAYYFDTGSQADYYVWFKSIDMNKDDGPWLHCMPAFGDESNNWHTFKLVYDADTMNASAFVDDFFLSSRIVDLSNFRISVSTKAGSYMSAPSTVEFDNFRFQADQLGHTLNVDSSNGGSVIEPGEGEFQFIKDEQVTLIAQPDNLEYQFAYWDWEGQRRRSYTHIQSIVMDTDYHLTAVFKRANTIVFDQNDIFEARNPDLVCTAETCTSGAFQIDILPDDPGLWIIDRFELVDGVAVHVMDRLDDLPDQDPEVVYVRNLILPETASLNINATRLYYQSLEGDLDQITTDPTYQYAIDIMTFNEPNEYANRVQTNNEPNRIFVEHLPDEGLMRMQNIENEHAQASVRFDEAQEQQLMVRIKYRFNQAEEDIFFKVYVCDQDNLADRDPLHCIEAGLIISPVVDQPGSVGSREFGLFESWVDVSGLDLSQGIWIELELFESIPRPGGRGLFAFSALSDGDDPSGDIDEVSVETHCGGICMDLTGDDVPTSKDFSLVASACARRVSTTAMNSPLACVDNLGFSTDGYTDAMDVASWDWLFNECDDQGCDNLCDRRYGFSLNSGSEVATIYSGRPTNIASWISSVSFLDSMEHLLIMGKPVTVILGPDEETDLQLTADDQVYFFDTDGNAVPNWPTSADTSRANIKLLRGSSDRVHVINSLEGIIDTDGQTLIGPGHATFGNETVYVGIHDNMGQLMGRPVLDAAIDNNSVYVCPVLVASQDNSDAYLAGAMLQATGNGAFMVQALYRDLDLLDGNRQNPNLTGIREIERDGPGNLYLLNVHGQNQRSDILWKFDQTGQILVGPVHLADLAPKLADPIGLCVVNNLIYVSCGLYSWDSPDTVKLYGFSTTDLTLVQTITITNMSQVTDISAADDGRLYVVGMRMHKMPKVFDAMDHEPPFPHAYYAEIPAIRSDGLEVVAHELQGSDDLGLPMSILWIGP